MTFSQNSPSRVPCHLMQPFRTEHPDAPLVKKTRQTQLKLNLFIPSFPKP